MAATKDKLDDYFKNLGKLISKFRKDSGLSLEELGLEIGQDKSAMHRIENGKHISVTTVIKLAIALNKKPKDFLSIDFDFVEHDLSGFSKPNKKTSKKKSKAK